MWSGIVLLQNHITLLHKRDCNRTQDLIPIPYCGHIARNNNQLWFYPVSNASPDHNGATPKPIPFDNTGVGKAFSATSVHTTSTICAIEGEPRLVRKKNSSPLLIGNSLGACAVNHAIRRNLRAWVRDRPTYGRRARRPISRNRLPTVLGEICRLCVPTVLNTVKMVKIRKNSTLRFFFLSVYTYIKLQESIFSYSFVKCGCSIYCFLTLSTLICRGTDISKCFSESLGIRDNESRLYMYPYDQKKHMSCRPRWLSGMHVRPVIGKSRVRQHSFVDINH